MNTKSRFTAICLLAVSVLLVGCGPSEQEIAARIATAAVATIEAIPTSTPEPTPIPNLVNLFCEYDFCIGHPSEVYLTDTSAPEEWNTYRTGVVLGTDGALIMGVEWHKVSESEWDLEFEARDLLGNNDVPRGETVKESMGIVDP